MQDRAIVVGPTPRAMLLAFLLPVAAHGSMVQAPSAHHNLARGAARCASRIMCAPDPEPGSASTETSSSSVRDTEPSPPPANSLTAHGERAQNFDGSLDAIYKAAEAARLAARERGQAEGEDFDFCCPSAPDDLIGFMSAEKGTAEDSPSSEGAAAAQENTGPISWLMGVMGF